MSGILAVDPGPEVSAWVLYDRPAGGVIGKGYDDNGAVLRVLRSYRLDPTVLAVEMVASYGMAVGADVFETVLWVGRFIECWQPGLYRKVYRRDVKMHLCGNARAKDANIRTALIDKFGGSKEKAVGVKKSPGPLYGVSSHIWSALAVAVTAAETGAFAVRGETP